MGKFQPFGPFVMQRDGIIIDTSEFANFWTALESENPGLSSAVGCYVFAIRAAKGAKPWYVGKTEKRSLKDESWSPHKLYIYRGA